MDTTMRLLAVTQALADPLRLALVQRLMAGEATTSELMAETGATQSNVSNHLAVLRESGLVNAQRVGRQSVYALRDATVAQAIESLLALAGASPQQQRIQPRQTPAIAAARTCYDHLAGRLGVALYDALVARGALLASPVSDHVMRAGQAGAVTLGSAAADVFGALGIDPNVVRRERRRLATACLDWTERRPHLGGALGAALWAQCLARGWVIRQPGTREVIVTDAGRQSFHELLGVTLEADTPALAGSHA
ncbi:MAG TPA: metalloregulator ArsR/SmtB family transcription factor [Ktedonobacterales bacterium]|nr:metalloregulator ArsR/SmtB family transcription factor [Ktedonobacterales bacterium]